MDILMLGANHRTSDLEAREKLAFSLEEQKTLMRAMVARDAVVEAALIVTCNRTEVYAAGEDLEAVETALREVVCAERGADLLAPGPGRDRRTGADAAAHLHRVAAGLDSMVLGEKQILGQVKEAWCEARGADALGAVLDKLFASAVHAGKRARTETDIDCGAVSVPSAAVSLAGKVFGDLEGRDLVVVGAGETGRLAAVHFAERRPARLRIVNRTPERAAALAAEVSAEAWPFERLSETLVEADVVAFATRAPEPVIDAATIAAALHHRPHRPLVILDLAVPRDVDPAAADLENVFLHPVDALRGLVDQSLARRQREVPKAEAIALEESGRFLAWWRGLGATPVLRELRAHFEKVRAEEVARSLRHFSPQEHERVERLTQALVNKLLHLPMTRLRTLDADTREGIVRLDAVRELFALDGERAPKVDRGA